MYSRYIPAFADFMASGLFATTADLIVDLQNINQASHQYIQDLGNGNTEYDPRDYAYWEMACILHKANHDSYHLLSRIQKEYTNYQRNMRILHQEYTRKYYDLYQEHGYHATQKWIGDDVLESAAALGEMTWEHEPQQPYDGYLTEIFRFWRRYGGQREHEEFEEVWRWVAGRPLPHLEKDRLA